MAANSGNSLNAPPGRGQRGGPQAQRSLSAWLRAAQSGASSSADKKNEDSNKNNNNNSNNNQNSSNKYNEPQSPPQQQQYGQPPPPQQQPPQQQQGFGQYGSPPQQQQAQQQPPFQQYNGMGPPMGQQPMGQPPPMGQGMGMSPPMGQQYNGMGPPMGQQGMGQQGMQQPAPMQQMQQPPPQMMYASPPAPQMMISSSPPGVAPPLFNNNNSVNNNFNNFNSFYNNSNNNNMNNNVNNNGNVNGNGNGKFNGNGNGGNGMGMASGQPLASARRIDNSVNMNYMGGSVMSFYTETEVNYGKVGGKNNNSNNKNNTNNNNNNTNNNNNNNYNKNNLNANNGGSGGRIKAGWAFKDKDDESPSVSNYGTVLVKEDSKDDKRGNYGYAARHLNNPSVMTATTIETASSYDSDDAKTNQYVTASGPGSGPPSGPGSGGNGNGNGAYAAYTQYGNNNNNNSNNNGNGNGYGYGGMNVNVDQPGASPLASAQPVQSPEESVTVTYYNQNHNGNRNGNMNNNNNNNNGGGNSSSGCGNRNNGRSKDGRGQRKQTLEEYDPWAAENKKLIDDMTNEDANLGLLQANMQYLPQSTQNVLQSYTQQYGNFKQEPKVQAVSKQEMLQIYSQYNAQTLSQLDRETLKKMPCFECGLPLSDVSHWIHGMPAAVQPYNENVSGNGIKVLGSQLCLTNNNKQKMCVICKNGIGWGQGYQSKTLFVNGNKVFEYTCNPCYLQSCGKCRVCGMGFKDINQVLGGKQTGYSLHKRCLVCQFCNSKLNPAMQIFWENDRPSHKRSNEQCLAQQ